MTFDTSLVDLHTSFSTTDSDPSSDVGQPQPHPEPTTSNTASQLVSPPAQIPSNLHTDSLRTRTTYDQWSTTYDTDGNMLQSIDDIELETLLPKFMATVLNDVTLANPHHTPPLSFLDLGCGTGRNTAKLLTTNSLPTGQPLHVTGLDFSPPMLDKAREKLTPLTTPARTLRLSQADCFPTATSSDPTASPNPLRHLRLPQYQNGELEPETFDGLLSTLVLEHIPLSPFFATVSSLLRAGGHALVTNMHSDMGRTSSAGFVNGDGVKVRGTSYVYTVEETVDAAAKAGLEVLEVRERGVSREDVEEGRVGKRGEKWVGVRVWYGVWLRKTKEG
jgi:SAM-dependent methyltransferase